MDGAVPGLEHIALLYSDHDSLSDEIVAFAEAGWVVGDDVILQVPGELRDRFLDILKPPHTSALAHDAFGDLYTLPHHALWGVRQHLDERPFERRGVRLVSQVDYRRTGALTSEWGRVEALANHVFRSSELTMLCLYDATDSDLDVIEQARQTHPALLSAGLFADNPDFVGPREYLSRADAGWANEPLEAFTPAIAMDLETAQDLRLLRSLLDDVLGESSVPVERHEDFRTAVFEVAVNALLHGGESATVRVWSTGGRLLCRIRDDGTGLPDPLTGYEPPTADASTPGRGLWSARQLADAMSTTIEPAGFTVRLSVGS